MGQEAERDADPRQDVFGPVDRKWLAKKLPARVF